MIVCELAFIISLIVFLLVEKISLLCEKRPLSTQGEILWHIDARRNGRIGFSIRRFLHMLGKPKENSLELEEGSFIMGNGFLGTDIYLDTPPQEKLKLFLDVRRECIYITVLQGAVTIAGFRYAADPHKRIRLDESMRFRIHAGNIDLSFRKER